MFNFAWSVSGKTSLREFKKTKRHNKQLVPKCLLCTRHCAYLPDFSSDLVRWWYSLHFTGEEVGSESCSQSGHNCVCHSHWINMMWPMRQHHGQPPCHIHWGCSFVPHFPVSELLYTTSLSCDFLLICIWWWNKWGLEKHCPSAQGPSSLHFSG